MTTAPDRGPRPEGEHEVRGLPFRDDGEAELEPVPHLRPARPRRIGWRKLTIVPAFLVAMLLATWLWFDQADLDTISENALSGGQVSKALWQHVQLTVISTFFVLIIAIPLGVLLIRLVFRRHAARERLQHELRGGEGLVVRRAARGGHGAVLDLPELAPLGDRSAAVAPHHLRVELVDPLLRRRHALAE